MTQAKIYFQEFEIQISFDERLLQFIFLNGIYKYMLIVKKRILEISEVSREQFP